MNPARLWRRAHAMNPFAANAAVTAAANLVLAVFGIVTGIAAARLLGPHGRGELAAIQTTPSFIATLAMLGLPQALTYYSAQNPGQAGRYLGTASVLAVSASVPFMIAGYFAMPTLLRAQDGAVIAAARWYLLTAPIGAIIGMLPAPLCGSGHFDAWNASRLMSPVLVVCVLAIALISNRATASFVAFGYLGSSAILFLPLFWLVRRRIPDPYVPDASKIRPMLRYGFPCVMTGVPQLLNLRLDQMLIAALLPPRELGLYAVAVAWSQAPAPLLSALGVVTTPAVASAVSLADASTRLAATVRAAVVLALALAVSLGLCTPIAIALLFGPAFAAALPAAMVLVPATAVLGVNFVLQEGLRGMDQPYAVLQAELGGLVVTAVILAVTLRSVGIMGAALASFFGYTMVGIVLIIKTQESTSLSLSTLLCPNLREIQTFLARLAMLASDITGFTFFKHEDLPEGT
jgi:O-antigen/teichoic acid export membrane protein